MSMRDGRKISARREDAGDQPVLFALPDQCVGEIHPDRCDSHYAAASLAVVCGPRDFAAIGMQGGKASGSRCAPAQEVPRLEKPAWFRGGGQTTLGNFLGHQRNPDSASSKLL